MAKKVIVMFLFSFYFNGMFAQSYDLKKIDDELCKIGNEDQQIRKKLIDAMQSQSTDLISIITEMKSNDAKNQLYVSDILDNHGWPEKLSENANRAIFLVIDHANNQFSEKYFPLVQKMADAGVLFKSDVVTLEDRILMRSFKPQKYGTQTVSQKSQEGEDIIYIWPIENNENVDEMRASVGLPSMNSYMQLLESQSKRKVIWDKSLKTTDFNITFQ